MMLKCLKDDPFVETIAVKTDTISSGHIGSGTMTPIRCRTAAVFSNTPQEEKLMGQCKSRMCENLHMR